MEEDDWGAVPYTIVPPGVSRLAEYDVIEVLNKGDHGIVYKGFFKGASPPLPVAIKTLFFKNMPRELKEQSIRECSLIMVLRHPNVIGCYDAFLENGELHMILELAGGDLNQAISDLRVKSKRFSEKDIWKMLYFLSQALSYLHASGVVHRDIRPSNLLLSACGQVKLADFGLGLQAASSSYAHSADFSLSASSADVPANAAQAGGQRSSSPCYTPPEVVLGQRWVPASDMWAVGVVLYEMCTLTLPFPAARSGDYLSLSEQIISGAVDAEALAQAEYSPGLVATVHALLASDPEGRPDAQSLAIAAKRALSELKNERTGSSGRFAISGPVVARVVAADKHQGSRVIIRANARSDNLHSSVRRVDLASVTLKSRIGGGARSTVWLGSAREAGGSTRDGGTTAREGGSNGSGGTTAREGEGKVVETLVAVKCVQGDDALLDDVEKEVDLLCALSDHRQIVYCYGSLRRWNAVWVVMEHCAGGDFARVVAQCRQLRMHLPEVALWHLLRQAASALRHAHRLRVVHRDIKPPNFLLTSDFQVKLADMGVGRRLSSATEQAFTTVGTPCYMAPEAIASRGVTAASDMWGLGCVMFELAALQPAFSHEQSLFQLAQDIASKQVPLLADCVPADAPLMSVRLPTAARDGPSAEDRLAEERRRARVETQLGGPPAPSAQPPGDGRLFSPRIPPFTDDFLPPRQLRRAESAITSTSSPSFAPVFTSAVASAAASALALASASTSASTPTSISTSTAASAEEPAMSRAEFEARYGGGLYSARLTWLISALLAKHPEDRPDAELVYACATTALQLWGPHYLKAAVRAMAKAEVHKPLTDPAAALSPRGAGVDTGSIPLAQAQAQTHVPVPSRPSHRTRGYHDARAEAGDDALDRAVADHRDRHDRHDRDIHRDTHDMLDGLERRNRANSGSICAVTSISNSIGTSIGAGIGSTIGSAIGVCGSGLGCGLGSVSSSINGSSVGMSLSVGNGSGLVNASGNVIGGSSSATNTPARRAGSAASVAQALLSPPTFSTHARPRTHAVAAGAGMSYTVPLAESAFGSTGASLGSAGVRHVYMGALQTTGERFQRDDDGRQRTQR